MTTELIKFKKRAHQHNICDRLSQQWDSASSLQEVANTGLDIQGIEFLCRGAKEGWGIDTDYLAEEFAPYINGHYIYRSPKGYKTALYCKWQDGEITPNATCTCILDSTAVVSIPANAIRSLYIAGDSEISIWNDGYCTVHIYGDCDVTFQGSGKTHIKRA